MDSYLKFSGVQPVRSTSLSEAFIAFEKVWIFSFWPPQLSFPQFEEFLTYLEQCNISYLPFPPGGHYKNLLKPKIFRDPRCLSST